EAALGGRSLEDQTWLEMMHLILGSPPRALWVHDRAERWSVRFAKQQPIVIRFDNDRLELSLNVIEIKRGSKTYRQPTQIEAKFDLKITREGPTLFRDGNLALRVEESGDQEA